MIRLVASAWPEPSVSLDPGDCIHVTLTLEIDGAMQVLNDACIRDWILFVAHALDDLVDADSSASGLVHVKGARAHVRLAPNRPQLACDARELEAAFDAFLEGVESRVTTTYSGGAQWWADARERVARVHSDITL